MAELLQIGLMHGIICGKDQFNGWKIAWGKMAKEKIHCNEFFKGSPFIQTIVHYPTPSKIKPLVVTIKYDGKTDQILHVEKYQAITDIFCS